MDKNTHETSNEIMTEYLKRIGEYPLLSKEEEAETIRKAQAGDTEAKNLMIVSNLRLVVYVAKNYYNSNSSMRLPDIIQEGNIALLTAIDKFKPELGNKFSTYASKVIGQQIKRAIDDQTKEIYLPSNKRELLSKVSKAQGRLRQELSREPKPEEIAEELGIPTDKIIDVLTLPAVVKSLDDTVSDDRDSSRRGEFITTETERDPLKDYLNSPDDPLTKGLRQLSERDEDIIRLRFGLDGNKPLTIDEIAERYHITRQKAVFYEKRALRRLHAQMEDPL
ncbi:MAG: RNA polymerase sigma factor RpoD/SigA [Solobacterium sp.]|nr:RNA polymerase sigma factor RpoD/SigA [Solobacterium sp.]